MGAPLVAVDRALWPGPLSCLYSSKCLELEFCELRLLGILRTSSFPRSANFAATEPTPTASATPLATNTVRAMVANNTMVRLIKRPPLCRGAEEERCQTPARQTPAPLRNEGSILLSEGDVCAPWHKTRQSPKKAPNFRELRKSEVQLRRLHLLSTSVNRGKPLLNRPPTCPEQTRPTIAQRGAAAGAGRYGEILGRVCTRQNMRAGRRLAVKVTQPPIRNVTPCNQAA